MKVAALYDVHGNLPALEAVLAEVPDDAAIVSGGDVFSGPMPTQTLARLGDLGQRVSFVRGNADRDLGPYDERWRARYEWLMAQLTPEAHALAEAWPATVTLDIDGLGQTLFCHGSPRGDLEAITAITSDERLREILSGVTQRTVVCGHTHHQFDRTIDEIRVVNAGSIGMPYEGRPGAYWALLGPEVEFRRTEYDLDAAAEAIRATSYPDPEERIELLTSPHSAEEAAEVLEQRALEGLP
ncbi:MAG: metallophosphoesterase family protein [Actinobacteria bacterium]|nr:MAG: metallophosphoesterase family protein [Actinomycetota bacterium]